MLLPILAFPVHFLFVYCQKGGLSVLLNNIRPLPDWGPFQPENRTGRYSLPARLENGDSTIEHKYATDRHKMGVGSVNIGFEFDHNGYPSAYPDLDNTHL